MHVHTPLPQDPPQALELQPIAVPSRKRFCLSGRTLLVWLAGAAAFGFLLYMGSWLLFGRSGGSTAPAGVQGNNSLMDRKAHGTCTGEPAPNLRWGCDRGTADRICCFNRRYAERWGYWTSTTFPMNQQDSVQIVFYDTVTGKPLFVAPRNRSYAEFVDESRTHGWPSFRDSELVMDNVRVLPDGETVSVDGTHLGHNLPDSAGNRYCINLVSVAAQPPSA